MKHTPFTLARETAENRENERVFLASYRFLFIYSIFFGFFLTPFLFVLMSGGVPFSEFLRFLSFAAWFLPLAFAAVAFPLTWLYRVRVKPEGIHGGTFWSTPVYMTFAEMESVEPRNFLGLPYLRVKSFRDSCPTLWIPRFLANLALFQEAVSARTAPTNPLRKSLENGNTSAIRESLPQK